MSKMISLVSITAFVMMTGYMWIAARFSVTRKVAGVSLFMAVAEVALFGLLSAVSNPAVTLLLIAARLTVLTVCVLAMHHDREAAKARQRRKNRFRADMYNTMEPLRLVRRQRAAAHIDIAA